MDREGTMATHEVRVRTWLKAKDRDVRRGLLGYLSVTYGDLILTGLVLRRTASGRLAIAFPEKTDGVGLRHAIIRPASPGVRQEIEDELLWQLGKRGDFVA